MNTFQLCRQVKKLLSDRTWELPNGDSSSNKVFADGSVFITAGSAVDRDALSNRRTPLAMIHVLNCNYVETHEIEQNIGIRIMTSVPGDAIGEVAIMGGSKTLGSDNPQERSQGRGLLEIAEQVQLTLAFLSKVSGVTLQMRGSSAIGTQVREDNQYVAIQDYTFKAYITDGRYYPNGSMFRVVNNGGDPVTYGLAWKNPPTAGSDFHQMQVRRGDATTDPAPNNITDGTPVYAGSAEAVATVDNGYNYALFATYDSGAFWSPPISVKVPS